MLEQLHGVVVSLLQSVSPVLSHFAAVLSRRWEEDRGRRRVDVFLSERAGRRLTRGKGEQSFRYLKLSAADLCPEMKLG